MKVNVATILDRARLIQKYNNLHISQPISMICNLQKLYVHDTNVSKWHTLPLTFGALDQSTYPLQTSINPEAYNAPQCYFWLCFVTFITHNKPERKLRNVKRQKSDRHIKGAHQRRTVSPQRQICLSVSSVLPFVSTWLSIPLPASVWFRHHSCGGLGQAPH